jgi:hypothetical protein
LQLSIRKSYFGPKVLDLFGVVVGFGSQIGLTGLQPDNSVLESGNGFIAFADQ